MESVIYPTDTYFIAGEYRYYVIKSFSNGLVVGQCAGKMHMAVSRLHVTKGRATLRPVIGTWSPVGLGGIIDRPGLIASLQTWMSTLRTISRMALEHLLKGRVEPVEYVKVKVEDWSEADLASAQSRGWLAGFSADKPLWRIYCLIPANEWHGDEDFWFDGQAQSLDRFGQVANLSGIRCRL
jgi:hypothetical protein